MFPSVRTVSRAEPQSGPRVTQKAPQAIRQMGRWADRQIITPESVVSVTQPAEHYLRRLGETSTALKG